MPNLLNRVFAAIFASAVCYGLCASSMAQSAGGSSELFPGRFFSSDPLQLTATSATPIRLGFADLDHDGLPEALPSSSTFSPEGTYVQHNDGASGFSAPVHIGRERLVDDLDHDGVSDLAFVEKTTGASVDVRLSNGSGGFGPVIHTFLPAVLSVGELSWRSAQVDADGHADLLVWGLWYLHVVVLRGDGQGGFTAAVGFPCIGNPADVQAIDANQDGALDLIVRCFGPDFFVLLVSNGQGGFASPVKLEDMSWGINDFALGDFDANGWIDVAASRPNNGARLHFATGPATFAPSVPIFGSAGFGPSPVGSSYSIHARDYDADGVEDVLVASASDTGWYRGVPAAMPAAFQSHGFALAVSYPRLADPDADGSEDWVVPFGNGFATADWKAPKPIDSTALAGASRLRATDLDHDGRLDLVGFVSQKLQVALGDGSGRFALHDEESLVQCHGLATLDADADGATDVIASVPGSPPSWTLYSGDGTGKLVFQAALPVPSG
ncbi:MAG: VCBS repeat-containing protein, partial [Planctomycetota bacterium]